MPTFTQNTPVPQKTIRGFVKPPELGEVVARGSSFFGECFRCLLEITPEGYYLVQEFSTAQGEQRSAPYVLTTQEALFSSFFDHWQTPKAPVNGPYSLWDSQGQLYLKGGYVNGQKEGLWEYWSVDGHKLAEEHYINGQLDGPFKRWVYGTIFREGHYQKGKKVGLWKQWWFNGQLKAQGGYHLGMRQGEWVWWRKDGLKIVYGNYSSGRKIGVWLRWNRFGKLVGEKDYSKERVDFIDALQELHGILIDWNRVTEQNLLIREHIDVGTPYDTHNNQYSRDFLGITPEGHYIVQDSYFEGDEKFTDPYLLIHRDAIFTKDFDYWTPDWQLTGTYTQWHPNAQKKQVMQFKNGLRHGHHISWDDQGNKITEKTFSADLLNGFYCTWHPNGQMREKRFYSHNRCTGLWVSWWENGQKKCQGTYQNDLLHGRWNWWHKNGVDMAQGHYKNGIKTGEWIWWDQEQTIVSKEDFGKDKNISEWLLREYQIKTIYSEWLSDEEVSSIPVGFRFEVYDIDYNHAYSRVFLGLTPEGFSVVQDFYWDAGDRQRTAPYLIQNRSEAALLYCEIDDIQRCGIEGVYQQWYPTGELEFSAQMKSGKPAGLWKWWSQTSHLLKEISHDDK